jgi:general stress protein 26
MVVGETDCQPLIDESDLEAQLAMLLEHIRETMQATPYCFLITLDGSGQPQARLMRWAEQEPNLTLWLVTNPATRKAQELRADSRATVACYDPQGEGYVTLAGRARLVSAPLEKRRHWQENWEDFFPAGPDDPAALLIEFTPERVEVMSFYRNLATTPFTFRPLILVRRGSGWRPEEDTSSPRSSLW